MSVPLTIQGVTYNYPTEGDLGWGQQATAWAGAVTNALGPGSNATFLTLHVTGTSALDGNVTFGNNATFSGVARRIIGDMDNASLANRVMLRSANNNSISIPIIAPTGTGIISGLIMSGTSDPDNSPNLSLRATTSYSGVYADKTGAGAYQDLRFGTSGVDRQSITVAGTNVFGGTSPFAPDISGSVQIISANDSPLKIRHSSTAAGKYWQVGPWSSNGFVISIPSGTGVGLTEGATAWAANSDERLKADLSPISGGELWDWFKTVRAEVGRYKIDEEGTQRAFLIAQDWVDKPSVTNAQDDGMLTLAATNTLPYAYAVLKAAMERIEQLESRIAQLETKRK